MTEPIDKRAYEQDGRNLDGKLTSQEVKFLQSHHADILDNREAFRSNFGIDNIIEKIKMGTANKEEIAIAQAYLFEDDKEIDGIAGKATQTKVKSPNILNSNTKNERGYTLSKVDFHYQFEGNDFYQKNIGDCRLIATVYGLTKLNNYESLIRSSVYLDENGVYTIKLPLGDKNGKEYTVTSEDLLPQSGIHGEDRKMLDTSIEGIHAIIHAFGQQETGQKKFDFSDLTLGNAKDAIERLIYGMQVTEYSCLYSGYKSQIERSLKSFNSNQMITVGVSGDSYYDDEISGIKKMDNILPNWSNIQPHIPDHVVTIHKVNKDLEGNIKTVEFFDPVLGGDEDEIVVVAYPECIDYFGFFTVGSFNNKTPTTETSILTGGGKINNRKQGNEGIENEVISRYMPETINSIITSTGWRSSDQRISRGDVIVKSVSDQKYSVDSRGKTDTNIIFNNNSNDISICIGKKKLFLSTKSFSNNYKGEKDNRFQKYLYPPRISVFINKMRHDYIDDQKGDKKNQNPFGLYNGSLVFDDDYSTASTKRQAAEYWANDDTVSVLEDRSLLGIDPKDTATKQQIVKFLNELYQNPQ